MLDAVLILGPTASGKTALGVSLAKTLNSEVISIDSALIYRGMDIGTAKPTVEERQGVIHHLIDIRDPFDTYNAADFVRDCYQKIQEIKSRGKLPLIVGGTMLYAKAIKEGLNEMPSTDLTIRAQIEEQAAQLGWPGMHELLAQVDPITAARLNPNDSQRISRALEVYRQTGQALSVYQARQTKQCPYRFLTLGLVPADRALLHKRIEQRFQLMIEAGFLDEVRSLMRHPNFSREAPAMRAVGYRQAIDYLLGECDWDRFFLAGVAATRQLAKRQLTWMRSMPDLLSIDPFTQDAYSVALKAINAELSPSNNIQPLLRCEPA